MSGRSSVWGDYQLSQQLGSALRRMEMQIEYLTSLVESISEKQQQQREDSYEVQTHAFQDRILPPVDDLPTYELVSPTSSAASDHDNFSSCTPSQEAQTDESGPSSDFLILAREQASSSMNFAVRVLRQMLPTSELFGRNIAGVRGKQPVDPVKVSKIRALITQFYPASPLEKERIWTDCRKAMDSYIRKLKRDQ